MIAAHDDQANHFGPTREEILRSPTGMRDNGADARVPPRKV